MPADSATASRPVQTDPLACIRDDVRALQAYRVQPADGLVKLDAMENPFGLPPALQDELGQRLGRVAVNRYPGAQMARLKDALRAQSQPPVGWDIMLGNGSDELISLVTLACARPGASVLAPLPGFVMYEMSARLHHVRFHGVALQADFSLDVPAMLQAIRQRRPSVVYLAYPNNPTANLWDRDAMAAVMAAQREQGGLVVVDEAYQPFAAHTWMDELRAAPERHAHVLLMRTLSKFGLAGARVGYMAGPPALVAEVEKLRPPYNVSVLNAECALFALEHAAVFEDQAAQVRAGRDALHAALSALPGVTPFASQANMILARVPDAAATFAGLRARGVLVKDVSALHPLLAGCIRITVGTAGENQRLLAALQDTLTSS